MRIEREKTAAVCIDYQEKILPAVFESEQLIENSTKLLNGLKTLEIPIYLTQQYTKGLGATVPEICRAAGTKDYLEKLSYSAYPTLREVLPFPEEKPYVVVCGIESHVCVLQTALDLKANGYQPYLVADCVSSRKRGDYEMALERIRQEGGLLTTYEAILFELQKEAGNLTSRAIQKIVK